MYIAHGQTIFFDVDGTLVIETEENHPQACEIEYLASKQKLLPHKRHIALLREYKHRGYVIVVWSAGGSGWAEAVIKSLGLERYVDLIVSKPDRYVDDLKAKEFLHDELRIYEPIPELADLPP